MDKVKRKVAAETLNFAINYRFMHDLWRVKKVWGDGLTPKEQAYIEKISKDLDEIYTRLGALQNRLNRTT